MAWTRRGRGPWVKTSKKRITTGYGVTKRKAGKKTYSAKRGASSSTGGGKRRRMAATRGAKQSDAGYSACTMRFKRKSKFMKGLKKILAPQILQSVVQTRVTSNLSRQGIQLLTTYSGQSGASPYLLGASDMADMQLVLGSTEALPAQQGSANNTTPTTRRMMIQNARAKYTMKNMTNSPIEVTLYDVSARRDGINSTFSPVVAWENGLVDQTVAVGGTNANNQVELLPGAKPFQSQLFCQLWKVKRVTNFVLHPGSEHIHTISISPGGVFNNEFTRNYALYKGLSTACMAVIKGGIIQDTVSGGPFNVSFAAATLDVVCESSYRFTAMERSRTAFTQYNLLPTTLTNPQLIVEDLDGATAPIAL